MTKCGDPGCGYCGEDRLEYSAREYDRVVAERDRLLKATSPIHAHVDALRGQRDRLRAALEEALEYPRGLVARAREALETSDDRTTLDDSPRPQGSGI